MKKMSAEWLPNVLTVMLIFSFGVASLFGNILGFVISFSALSILLLIFRKKIFEVEDGN